MATESNLRSIRPSLMSVVKLLKIRTREAHSKILHFSIFSSQEALSLHFTLKLTYNTHVEQLLMTWSYHVEAVRKKCLGGLAKLRRLRDTLRVALKKKHLQCLSVAASGLLLCALARM